MIVLVAERYVGTYVVDLVGFDSQPRHTTSLSSFRAQGTVSLIHHSQKWLTFIFVLVVFGISVYFGIVVTTTPTKI
jgi:hypothetical protein